ncbi:Os04g0312733 [Oryza sativa Japonica Group]|uniref:Os04g0312733 protein n=1 Tax=Oryza sativa subsp. japonica TaxID=39947 RepID=A0A0P0W911_ORYSJ|nr:Os04g0312733 [Oryza sativa Japonica Group]
MVVKQWEKFPTLSCDGRDKLPRPKPAMPVSFEVKTPLFACPQPNTRPGTAADDPSPAPDANVKTSRPSSPRVTEPSP